MNVKAKKEFITQYVTAGNPRGVSSIHDVMRHCFIHPGKLRRLNIYVCHSGVGEIYTGLPWE